MNSGASLQGAAALAVMIAAVAATSAQAQIHCSQLPALTRDGHYPRASAAITGVVGFPDHLHAHSWPDWTPMIGPDGRPLGPGSLCRRREPVLREGLVIEPEHKSYGHWTLQHHPGYADCDMLPLIELMEWARFRMQDLLDLAPHDTLSIINPNTTPHYMELTNQGVWRMYALEGNDAVIQPFAVLLARSLDGHGTFMLAVDWILRQSIEQPLPLWLHQGLVEYLGENGFHLADFMAEFRPKGAVVMSAAAVDSVLAAGIDPDLWRDREQFYKACYNAFAMVWQLVEYEGGMSVLRDFLGRAAAGIDLDQAALDVYGLDMAHLAGLLDPAQSGEPAGGLVFNLRANKQP